MACRARGIVLAVWSVFLAISTLAQSSNGSSEGASCGGNITASREWYQIRFRSYCETKLFDANTAAPIKAASFQDCSIACVNQGITCGGFAFDRSSHYSEDNCYLNRATSIPYQTGTASENTWFDSATIDNSSLPITKRDCPYIGASGEYRGYELHCNEAITDDSVGNQNHLDTVFASSLSDCIDHCYNIQSDAGEILCQAVTWDPFELHGFQNCILKGRGYVEPAPNDAWDSATLIGTEGRAATNSSTSTSSTPSATASATDSANSGSASGSHKLSSGAIGGIAGGIAGLVLLGGALVVFLVRRHIKKSVQSHGTPSIGEVTSTNSGHPVVGPLMYGAWTGKSARGNEREINQSPNAASELDSTRISELAHSTSIKGKARYA